jgi:hypothetical protein
VILDVNGKKLAFALSWKALIDDADPATMAARVARDMNAKTIWHDGRALHMGALAATDRDVEAKDIYAAAAVLATMTDLGANSLFVFRLQQGSAAPVFLMVGVVRGRPRVGFDLVLTDPSAVSERAQEFARICPNAFVLAGNVESIAGVVGEQHVSATVVLSLEQLASAATPAGLMRKPRRVVSTKRRKTLILCLVLAVVAAKFGHDKWSSYQALAHRVTPDQQAAQAYRKLLATSMSSMSLGADATSAWYAWFRGQPETVGGWALSAVDCPVHGGAMQCALSFRPHLGQATNQSFVDAAPKEWPAPQLKPDGTQIVVSLTVPAGPAQRMADRLVSQPSQYQADLEFGSQLKHLGIASQSTGVGHYALYPNVRVVPSAAAGVAAIESASWTAKGPVRNADLIAQFPRYVTLDRLNLDIHDNTTPGLKASSYVLTASGTVYVKR